MKLHFVLFGNTNNEHFRLALALNKLGHNVTIILYQRGLLHDPSCLNEAAAQIKIHDLRFLEEDDFVNFRVPLIKIKEILNSGDYVIFDGVGPAFHEFCNVPFSTYITGSNLTYYASDNLDEFRTQSWTQEHKKSLSGIRERQKIRHFSAQQQLGISKSNSLIMFPTGLVPENDIALNSINAGGKNRLRWLVSDSNIRWMRKKRKRIFLNKTKVLVGFRIDKTSQHPGNSELDDKGVDNLYDLIVHNSEEKFNFTIFKKGKAFTQFKEQILRDNLSKKVNFIEEQSYKRFRKTLIKHDIILDSLGKSPIGRITVDGLSENKIVIGSMKKRRFLDFFPFLTENDLKLIHYFSLSELNSLSEISELSFDAQFKNMELISFLFDPLRQAKDIISAL